MGSGSRQGVARGFSELPGAPGTLPVCAAVAPAGPGGPGGAELLPAPRAAVAGRLPWGPGSGARGGGCIVPVLCLGLRVLSWRGLGREYCYAVFLCYVPLPAV
ncbi:hypothetical protein PABY_19230 [Pyrodictium abyssi]|uniref:Uncharacterized protein n=1 Tax=Pyrodictium abyssi TaxID=54256 RepID=A0ABM8IXS8_9CREN|nr:hypothetical protein PABY_19230 [Pyrodictium abyssi]